jgi:hypothetical protein
MLNDDTDLLASIEAKLLVIRDRVRGVAGGYHSGVFIWGEGGTGKSHVVEQTLREMGIQYHLTNSRVTGRGLFELMAAHRDVVHVLEDCEPLFRDQAALGVLLSALWGLADEKGVQDRRVSWATNKGREEVDFTGGLVLLANRRLDDTPIGRAVMSRLDPLEYTPTNAEIAAMMRKIASKGHRFREDFLSPEECFEVVAEIVARSERMEKNLDLRLLIKCFQDRLQWANGESETNWRDSLEMRMKSRVLPATRGGSKAASAEKELCLLRQTKHLPPQERLAVWAKETGKSRAGMYRRLAELEAEVMSQVSPSQDLVA